MLKVVIVGYGEMFTNTIAATLDANCKIIGVLRKETIKYPRLIKKIKELINPSTEFNYIKSYNLPEINTKSVNSENFRKQLLKLNPDIMIVASWGEKFSKETFSIPKIATLNVHPSLLPKYRGPNPYFWTIKNQEQSSGVTIHLMDENFDTGAILAQEEVKIYPSDTGETLKQRTVLTARGVICELLNNLQEDIVIPLKQYEEKATYYSHPEEFELDFKNSAEDNFALIRAIYPWNNAFFYHDITPIAVFPQKTFIENNNTNFKKAGTICSIDANQKRVSVICGDGKLLNMQIELYKKIDRFFTKNFIKRNMKIGDLLF